MRTSSGTCTCREARRPGVRRGPRWDGDQRHSRGSAWHAARQRAETPSSSARERARRVGYAKRGSVDRTWPRASSMASLSEKRVKATGIQRREAATVKQEVSKRPLRPPPWSRRTRRECRSCRRRVGVGYVVSMSGGPTVHLCRACCRWHGTGEHMMSLSYLGTWRA